LHLHKSVQSEEEDTAKKKKYPNERSLKTGDASLISASASTESPKTSHTRAVPLRPRSILPREEATHLQEKDSLLHATEEENKNHPAPPECSSLHQALNRQHVARSTRCDVWSQTESSVMEVEKVDVSTQCGTLQVCSCGSSLPAARSPGGVPAPSTAGGHKMAAPEVLRPAGTSSAMGAVPFSPEAEYLSLAGRRTLEVLSYIDIMKEREKQ